MFKVEKEFHGGNFSIETGRIAKQASGAVLVRYFDSVVLVTACMGEEKEGDFFPLTIDYVEKTYAAGKIPGGFLKREGKLSDAETLVSRLIDRPCRPLFPDGFNREVQVIATVMSADGEHDTDVLALCGASAALSVSEIPFEGPIAAVRVCRINGELKINPSPAERENADLNYIVAGSRDAIVMVEGGSKEVPENEVLDALLFAHKELQALIDLQEDLVKQGGKEKIVFEHVKYNEKLFEDVKKFIASDFENAVQIKEKLARGKALKEVKEKMVAEFVKEDDENKAQVQIEIGRIFEDLLSQTIRGFLFDKGQRIDGRKFTEVRPITIETGILPRTHGSALFTRGETQAIVTTTLGAESEAQRIDNLMEDDAKKKFILHYNFPPFSVGEARPVRGPGRREIGHGALAERAVSAILPDEDKFPYVIRIVSEICESNGSSSMATVCGSTLSLMDAGVPIKAPVAGVAMGLMKRGDDFVVLTDILGDEDHSGDMDFKVCGTEKGVTALQMDIKINGVGKEILEKALAQAHDGRMHILSKMREAISAPREEISPYAPKIVTLKINPDKIRDVIGQGGKTIRSIQESYNVKIDISEDGVVAITAVNQNDIKSALTVVQSIVAEAEVGKVYKGIVKRIADFGAFVEILPGTDGLLHISEIANRKIRRVEDELQVGDELEVKVLEVDRFGKIKLSRKALLTEE